MKKTFLSGTYLCYLLIFISCSNNNNTPSAETINAIKLKKGALVYCGPAGKEFGTVTFSTSCSPESKKDFDLAIALLHSFEYDESEKVFAKIIETDPGCAMAYWGVAMCNYHPVWPSPPTPEELGKGNKAIAIAAAIKNTSKREQDFINAMFAFYNEWKQKNHHTRSLEYQKAMERIYLGNPDDREAAVLYALSLVGTADPSDKTYFNQKKAGKILTALYPEEPDHPGIVHYIIHSYDYPEIANLALPAARKYAAIAPSSAHAQHMPSHIFIRLGLWDESIQSNLASTSSAKCYAENAGIKGHWDEELHGMDYLVYAYLQKGENNLAKQQYDYLKTIHDVYPRNFKVAYAFSAIPSRYYLENKMWKEAASLNLHPVDFPWQNFPWQKAIHHYARLLGSVHMNLLDSARMELQELNNLHDTLVVWEDPYKANQVMIQIKTGEAWIHLKENKPDEAVQLMKAAADLENKTEKSPVTPGEVFPAIELLGDLYMEINQPLKALAAYQEDLKTHPNRFNGLFGAGTACEKLNDEVKATHYFRQLTTVANLPTAKRPELEYAKLYLKKNK